MRMWGLHVGSGRGNKDLFFKFYFMKAYKDIDGDSWVIAYEYGNDFINVQFNKWAIYTYTYSSAWTWNIEHMKKLADQWEGLNAYIVKNKIKHFSKSA